jgi:polysaccharide export outer membrane protein
MISDCSKNTLLLIGVSCFAFLMSGCLTYKQIVNFQDGEDLNIGRIDTILNTIDLRVKKDDVIQVIVNSYEQDIANKFNIIDMQGLMQGSRSTGGGSSVTEPIGYRVDSKGNIDMPILGLVNIEGLTVEEVRSAIHALIGKTGYLKEFSVQIRFLTFRLTILGEVNNPGVYTIPNTKINVLEALGLASDVTVFSNRDNILVIRESDGIRSYGRIDLKSKSIFNSEFFYLQPNDVVYVEPHQSRILATPDPITRYVGTLIALGTLITLLIALF